MKRTLIVILLVALVAVLAFPSLAFAGKGNGKATGKSNSQAPATHGKAVKDEPTAKVKAPKVEGSKAKASSDSSDTPEAPESDEVSGTPGAGIGNALSRITSNLEKSLAKIDAGLKSQLPPGLVRVWMKFAGWLGIDPSTMPGAPSVPAVEEPTSTVEPTGTVAPTGTADPAPLDPVGAPAR